MTRERVRLAVLGDPLDFTLSPELHRAGLAAIGIDGESRALRTPAAALGERLRELSSAGLRGVNLTAPLKHEALAHLDRVSARSGRARSVNTVGFERARAAPAVGPEEWGRVESWGDTTDGPGFVDLLRDLGRSPAAERVLFLGAGGAARSLALSLIEAGCGSSAVLARRPEVARADWEGIDAVAFHRWSETVDGEAGRRSAGGAGAAYGREAEDEARAGSETEDEARAGSEAATGAETAAAVEALARATLVVNATPLADSGGPRLLDRIARDALVIDLRYGSEPTPWIRAARGAGLSAWDGLGLLVYQARRSLSLWTGREVPLEPMARAVGWPR